VLTTSYWPADARAPLDEITVGDLLRRVAGQVPDRVALVDGQAAAADRRRWSYAELLAIAEDVAGALLARFKTPGQWFFVDSFPMTPSGKVRTFEVRQRFAEPSER
jgi:fatty-acyl-CoA synthase